MGETGIRKTEYGISKRLVLTLALVLAVIVWGISLQGLMGFALISILVNIGIEDWQTCIISNRHIAAILGLWLLQTTVMLMNPNAYLAAATFAETAGRTGAVIMPGTLMAAGVTSGISQQLIVGRLATAAVIYAFLYFVKTLTARMQGVKMLTARMLGGGDIKLIAVLSLFLGGSRSLYMLFTACLLAIACMKVKKSSMVPLGPSIAVAAVCCLMV